MFPQQSQPWWQGEITVHLRKPASHGHYSIFLAFLAPAVFTNPWVRGCFALLSKGLLRRCEAAEEVKRTWLNAMKITGLSQWLGRETFDRAAHSFKGLNWWPRHQCPFLSSQLWWTIVYIVYYTYKTMQSTYLIAFGFITVVVNSKYRCFTFSYF